MLFKVSAARGYEIRQTQQIRISLSSTFVVDAAVSPDSRTVAVVTIPAKEANHTK